MVDALKLQPHPKNPNTHPEQQIEMLAKIIKYQGWRNPIVVSKRSGFIIKGHARLAAAKLLNLEQVPVEYQDYENEAAEYADMIADNKIAEMAEIDSFKLGDILEDIVAIPDFDIELTGFTQDEVGHIFDEINISSENDDRADNIPRPPKVAITQPGDLYILGGKVKCPKCGKEHNL